MAAAVIYPHIVKEGAEPARLESHERVRVSMIVADYLWRGWSAEEIVRHYSYLTLAETHASLAYYFDNREEIDAELLAESRAAAAWKHENPTPELLLRLKERSDFESAQ